MIKLKSLSELNLEEKGEIVKVEASKDIKKRLLDLGIVKGNIITPVLISPGKDMVAYKVKETIIAIRKEDIKNIMVNTL